MRHLKQRQCRFFGATEGFGHHAFDHLEACFAGRAHATFKTIGQAVCKTVDTIDAAYANTFLRCFTRHKPEDVFTPYRFATQVRGQVHDRAVAARAGHQIAIKPFAGAGDCVRLDVDCGDAGSCHAFAATGFNHCAAGQNANAFGAGFLNQRAARVVPRIGNRNHLQAGVEPVQRNAVGMVVVGGQHQFLPGATP